MIQIKGSEKQIKWAEDIRESMLSICDKKINRSTDDTSQKYYQELRKKLENIPDPQFFIHSTGGFGWSMLKPGDELGDKIIEKYINPHVKGEL